MHALYAESLAVMPEIVLRLACAYMDAVNVLVLTWSCAARSHSSYSCAYTRMQNATVSTFCEVRPPTFHVASLATCFVATRLPDEAGTLLAC